MTRRRPRKPVAPTASWLTPALVAVVLATALGIRLYYFALTDGQPVWWDEAEYLIKARHIALGAPDTGYFMGRAILLPVFMSGFFTLGLGETAIRLALVAMSFASVYLTYSIGRRLFHPLAGLVAALLIAVFYVPVFFTMRFMTEIPNLALCLLAVDLFLARTPARTALSMPVLALGALVRFPSAVLAPLLLVHGALTEGRALLRRRALWLSFALAVAVGAPYLVWSYATYGHPLAVWRANQFLMPHLALGDRIGGVGHYLDWLRTSLGWMPSALAVLGLIVGARRCPFLVLWAIVPILHMGLLTRPFDDRYILLSIPPIFIAIGAALVWAAELALRAWPRLQTALVLAIAVVAAAPLLRSTDHTIHEKLTSYHALRDAGEWIRANTPKDTPLISSSVAQITYYAERPTLGIPKTHDQLEQILKDGRARFVVLSAYEPPPTWLQKASLDGLGLHRVAAFPDTKPEAIVLTYR